MANFYTGLIQKNLKQQSEQLFTYDNYWSLITLKETEDIINYIPSVWRVLLE